MARIFVTGSADGLGLLASKALINQGHRVVLHARNPERAYAAMKHAPGAEGVFTADLKSIDETKKLAEVVNQSGNFDVVIHNAGVYQVAPQTILSVNTLAPYILTSLIQQPRRLIYLSSGMHLSGRPNLDAFREGKGISYSDSKLHVVMLANAVARKWPRVYANAVDPGWVPTKMGGASAPDNLQKGFETQVWLATSEDEAAKVSGRYFYHMKERSHNVRGNDVALQDELFLQCEKITGTAFPNP